MKKVNESVNVRIARRIASELSKILDQHIDEIPTKDRRNFIKQIIVSLEQIENIR